jgi:hypothetical protein
VSPHPLIGAAEEQRTCELEAVVQSWFEDDPQLAQAVERARGHGRANLTTYLLQSVIARHRDRWADIVVRMALWMREAPPEADLCWRARRRTGCDRDRIDARYRIANDRGAQGRWADAREPQTRFAPPISPSWRMWRLRCRS